MTETTVETVEQTAQDVAYCDICGEARGSLNENGEYHFHDDCADDVFVDKPSVFADGVFPDEAEETSTSTLNRVRTTAKQWANTARSAIVPSRSLGDYIPEERLPPLLGVLVNYLLVYLQDHAIRTLLWPVGGLWWVTSTNFFGDSMPRDPKPFRMVMEYIMGAMMWFMQAYVLFMLISPVL